jgi:hypothetical protein
MSLFDERRAADAFWQDLVGGPLPVPKRMRAPGESLLVLPRGPLTTAAPEPFFGDAPGQGWQVAGWPGALFIGLRADDLVVRRRADGGYDAVPAADANPAIVFRGPDRRLRRDTLVLRRQPAAGPRAVPIPDEQAPNQVCGFFGPHNIRRTLIEICQAVRDRANAEWAAWHTGTPPAPLFEGNSAMFGRMFGYYLAANGTLRPDTLLAIQATALGAVNYAPLLTATTSAAANTAATTLATTLTAGAPPPAIPGLANLVRTELLHAREANLDTDGGFAAWSAVFVVNCVRLAGIGQGLETIVGTASTHMNPNVLLLGAVSHAGYTIEARNRTPGTTGTYQAFDPGQRAVRIGDIIVLDRQATTENGVVTLAALSARNTHGDIVVEVNRQQGQAITIGGNLGDGSASPPARQDSARKRRYPLDANGRLVRNRQQLITQEDNAGTLPALPVTSTDPLHRRSTARIFALLSPVERCVAVP